MSFFSDLLLPYFLLCIKHSWFTAKSSQPSEFWLKINFNSEFCDLSWDTIRGVPQGTTIYLWEQRECYYFSKCGKTVAVSNALFHDLVLFQTHSISFYWRPAPKEPNISVLSYILHLYCHIHKKQNFKKEDK